MSFQLPSIRKLCQDACQRLMLHPYITASSTIVNITKRPVPALGRGFLRYMPSPFCPVSVVLFQLHGGMVCNMPVIATPSSTVNNTKYLDPCHKNHISFSSLFLRQLCRDVVSGADRHLDITFGLQVVESSSLVDSYFLEKRLAIPTSPFFHLLVNVFSVTCQPPFFI